MRTHPAFCSAAAPAVNTTNFVPRARTGVLTSRRRARGPRAQAQGSSRSILVFGGGSTLGKEVVSRFSAAGWRAYTLDFFDASVECGGVNGCALPRDTSTPVELALPAGAPARTQVAVALKCLRESCAGEFDVVLNATLGFTPGGLDDDDVFESLEYMYKTSVESSLVTAKLASSFMAKGGMLVMIGSVAALSSTQAHRMLGFGSAKAAVHQMVRQLSLSVGDGLPERSCVCAVVPEVLDTPLHRSMNSGASAENWTPVSVFAEKVLQWGSAPESRPPNGALISVATSPVAATVSAGNSTPSGPSEHHFRLIHDSPFLQNTEL